MGHVAGAVPFPGTVAVDLSQHREERTLGLTRGDVERIGPSNEVGLVNRHSHEGTIVHAFEATRDVTMFL